MKFKLSILTIALTLGLSLTFFLLLSISGTNPTLASEGTPILQVSLYGSDIYGYNLTPTSTIRIEVYDQADGGVLIEGPLIVQTDGGGNFEHRLDTTLLQGQVVVGTDLLTDTTRVVILENIEITAINDTPNVVEGIAPPARPVHVYVEDDVGGWFVLNTTSDPISGAFSLDFSGIVEIMPNFVVGAGYKDSQGNLIMATADGILSFQAFYGSNLIRFLGFVPVKTFDYEIRDGSGGVLASDTLTASLSGPTDVSYEDHGIDLEPGYTIYGLDHLRGLTDTLELPDFTIEYVNIDTDLITGTQPVGEIVEVAIHKPVEGLIYGLTVEYAPGLWEVNTMAGIGVDLEPEDEVFALIVDEDNDVTFTSPPDPDGDGWPTGSDNAPLAYNPDQSDLDGDGIGDVADPCPDDPGDACNPDASAAASIDESGGTLTTPDGSASLTVPPGSLSTDTSVSVTDTGQDYAFEWNDTDFWALFSNTVGPQDIALSLPVTITFSWQDADADGIVDGTQLSETELQVLKDEAVMLQSTLVTVIDPDLNTITFSVNSFGDFILAGKLMSHWIHLPLVVH